MEKFKIFESIITYGIDLPYNEKYCDPCNLNQDVFFKELYLSRPEKEKKIEQNLVNSTKPLLVYGFPGTGKTTIISKVLRDIKKNKIIIKFDFKGKDQINELIDFNKWFKERLRQKLNIFLEEKSVSITDIILFLLSRESLFYELPIDIGDTRQKLFNLYKLKHPEMDIDFDNWLDNNKTDTEVYNQIKESFKYIRNRDILYYFSKKLNLSIFLFCDNMDSIIKNEIRQSFYSHIRSYSGTISEFVNIIVTARYSTISSQSYSDYGSYIWEKICLDYREFISEKTLKKYVENITKEKGYCNPLDIERQKDKIERGIKERFSKEFIKSRKSYYNKIIKERKELLKSNLEDQHEELLELIISNDHIHVALLELANHDRRFKLRYIIEFIKYIKDDLKINILELGVNDTERSFILESYFYHWIVINQRININKYNSIEEILKFNDGLNCSLSHLIITLIYNSTKKERGVNNHSYSITVGEVIDKIVSIGYDERIILKKIYELYKNGDEFIGLIEMSRFFSIISYDSINSSDYIWLTPRAIYLCEYLNSKYVFMLALYRKNKLKIYDEKTFFDYNDVNPITSKNLYVNLYFLKKMTIKHLTSLLSIKNNLNRDDWLDYYQKWFCLYQKFEDEDYKKRFQVEYILISHIKFLDRIKKYTRYDFITSRMVKQYVKLLNFYSDNVKNLVDNNDLKLEFNIEKDIFLKKKQGN